METAKLAFVQFINRLTCLPLRFVPLLLPAGSTYYLSLDCVANLRGLQHSAGVEQVQHRSRALVPVCLRCTHETMVRPVRPQAIRQAEERPSAPLAGPNGIHIVSLRTERRRQCQSQVAPPIQTCPSSPGYKSRAPQFRRVFFVSSCGSMPMQCPGHCPVNSLTNELPMNSSPTKRKH